MTLPRYVLSRALHRFLTHVALQVEAVLEDFERQTADNEDKDAVSTRITTHHTCMYGLII